MFFLFVVFNMMNAEVKIRESVSAESEKLFLYDFIITDNEAIIEKAKTIQMGYAPIGESENTVTGDYIKIKLKQLKILNNEELEKIVFPKNVIVKRIKKESIEKKTEKINENAKSDIVFIRNITVNRDKIFLSDFIESEKKEIKEKAGEIVIGYSPKPGEEKTIKSDSIKIKMKQLGIQNVEDYIIPQEFIITRENQKILKEEIIKILTQELTEAYENDSYKIKIEENGIVDIIIPQGIYNIKISPNPGESKKLGSFKTSCDIEVNGEVYKKIIISGETGIIKNIYSVKEDKGKGIEYSEDMFEQKDVLYFSETKIKPDISLEELKGKILKKNIKKGEILDGNMFEKKKLFKKNDVVTAIAVLDGATVKSDLKSLADGFEGENVSLVNPNSKKIITGVVQSDGTVLIMIQK